MWDFDKNWRENLLIWGGFAGLGTLAILTFFHSNRKLFQTYMKDPKKKFLFGIIVGTKKK